MKLILIAAALALTGCASYTDYYRSVDAANARQVEVQRAQAEADAIRYQALMRIAESGDATAKVAATMALALGTQGRHVPLAVPAQPQNEALQWASILVPGVTQGMGIYYNAKTNMNANNNATALGLSTNQTFGQFATEINSPTVVTQPPPLVVTQPPPVIVPTPDPIIVEPSYPPAP